MKIYLKHFILSFIFISFFLFFCSFSVFALENYDLSGISTYNVDESGVVKVTHEIQITNKKIEVYPTQYALSIPSTNLENVWGKDESDDIKPIVSTLNNQTTILVKFKNHSVGEGKNLNLSIGYDDQDICENIGRIWEINISKPENVSDFKNYKIILSVPKSFGTPIVSLPQASLAEEFDAFNNYEFSKDVLLKNNITYIFGDKQVFKFELHYSIENSNTFSGDKIIALPPDTQYQKLFYDSIIPEPLFIETDADGNWLAHFLLKSKEQLDIVAQGKVLLSLYPEFETSESKNHLEEYLQADEPWQVEDQDIKKLAQDLKTPQNIYHYIVENLRYNYQRINEPIKRYGAAYALHNSDNATCMEFTDLFIALSRAASISARELNGFAYTNNPFLRPLSLKQDILHAWPEYYDEDNKSWIQVDPTWENTTQGIDYFSKFDLNHFVFVIHGLNSSLPLPAGFYKTKNNDYKDVIVSPSSDDPVVTHGAIIDFSIPKFQFPIFNQKIDLIIKNTSNIANYDQHIKVTSDDFNIISSTFELQNFLLPFDTETIRIKIKNDKIFSSKSGIIKLELSGNTYEKQIEINSFKNQILPIITYLFLGAIFIKITQFSGSLLLRFKNQ